jgi:hypothetical protein
VEFLPGPKKLKNPHCSAPAPDSHLNHDLCVSLCARNTICAAEVVYSVRLARETSESETVRDEDRDRAKREAIQARGRRERERVRVRGKEEA